MTPEFQPKISPAKVRSICNIAGAVILVIGLISAAWIWQTQGRQQADPETSALPGSLSPDDSARYQRQVEIYSGKVGLLVERWTRQAAELGHGKALAETIAVVSLAGGGTCFLLGFLLRRLGKTYCHPTR